MKYCPIVDRDIKRCTDCNLCERQPVEPKVERAIYDHGSWHYVCGDCGGQIDISDNFCRHCGKPIEHKKEEEQ